MPVYRHDIEIPRLSASALEPWREVPAAVASDAQNRFMAMAAAISPLAPSMRILGQARTVKCMACDNSALHAAIGIAEPGDVLVVDGQSYVGGALFGGLLARSATDRGVGGIIIDGAVRDSEEIVGFGLPCYAAGVTPGGPHKGHGGVIDGPVACGGVAVAPGDLIVGDADGITVVPYADIDKVLAGAQAILAKEEGALASLAKGGSLAAVYGVPEITLI